MAKKFWDKMNKVLYVLEQKKEKTNEVYNRFRYHMYE